MVTSDQGNQGNVREFNSVLGVKERSGNLVKVCKNSRTFATFTLLALVFDWNNMWLLWTLN